ncbi:hypothetical protein HNV11_00235 [Spirosoma taeanense]|uniref:DUF3828 domain-containing protein n=1 Tax=Spirosoma taeanense TaxID=2735870 RepID=A0A6M5Y3E6_9BACT|nr:hypothetical protein [Spirosoma taeanense]QJW87910.1 hypothetical protein HNV11_00235 [Spirosoma taeanense]
MYSARITIQLLITILIFNASCQNKPKQETNEVAVAEQVDSAAALAKRPGPDAPRSAADRLVRALYFEHQKKENPFRETKDRSLVEQFFTKSTSDLIWAYKKPLKANLLFKVRDEAVKKTWVEPAAVGGSRAIVYTTFENNGKAQEIKLEMQQIAGRWRINDMVYPDGSRLTQLLQ